MPAVTSPERTPEHQGIGRRARVPPSWAGSPTPISDDLAGGRVGLCRVGTPAITVRRPPVDAVAEAEPPRRPLTSSFLTSRSHRLVGTRPVCPVPDRAGGSSTTRCRTRTGRQVPRTYGSPVAGVGRCGQSPGRQSGRRPLRPTTWSSRDAPAGTSTTGPKIASRPGSWSEGSNSSYDRRRLASSGA